MDGEDPCHYIKLGVSQVVHGYLIFVLVIWTIQTPIGFNNGTFDFECRNKNQIDNLM